jgi:HEAT repeat protein
MVFDPRNQDMSATIESARTLLASDLPGDRLSGLNQLRQVDPQAAFPLLQEAAFDKNTRVRYAAVSMMDSIGGVDLAKTSEILRDRLANDPEVDVKAAAADAIAALRIHDAYPELEAAYRQTTEWLLQVSIVSALGEFGDPQALPLLKDAIENPGDPLVRIGAIGAVGELRDPRGIDILANFVQDEDPQVRVRVAVALSYFDDDRCRQWLAQLATDADPQVASIASQVSKS